jgi:hypothetical protein
VITIHPGAGITAIKGSRYMDHSGPLSLRYPSSSYGQEIGLKIDLSGGHHPDEGTEVFLGILILLSLFVFNSDAFDR